jgi:cytochrome P450/ferredoxin-NADP reductase
MHQKSVGCPFHPERETVEPSKLAAEFDPFEGHYQLDPADALHWSRDQLPVFYSPKLNYWVVSRYDDVKAVFRDNILFSPRNVLEPISPRCPEALEVLKGYNYGMNRTLVNEDEPAHTERRRALSEHFLPANLEARQETIRRLVREKVDSFIDKGRVDLVEAMLYEVPLNVALHFLGVPEADFERLRSFSTAHAVNTFGRPTPEQQIEVAHSVGRFWQFAGEVISKMRAAPDGEGWMHYTIRKNAELPEVVTDSYVHSMMMAIIVAAHETTSLASASMFKTMLTHRDAWEAVCANPALIPNAVEECLRYVGSAVAWRRQATAPTRLGGVDIPEGAKLLIVQASANHDDSHFENGDSFDIYRDNAVDHLTFGYGSHQCMGKNIGRMEMRIFLDEVSRRLPHLRLAEQKFEYLPNTSFRGPKEVWVEWDPKKNPERANPRLKGVATDFPVGAPERRDIARTVRVTGVRREAEGIVGLTLTQSKGQPLPPWSAGSHVELCVGDYERKYSICGSPDASSYDLAILREDGGRGGSRHIHEVVREGMELRLRGPSNLFRLDEDASFFVLIAGGIGITPILAMADRLKELGCDYVVHYAGRSRRSMAFLDRIEADHAGHISIYARDEGRRADLPGIVRNLPVGCQIYTCGPERMIAELEALTAGLPAETLHFEHFSQTIGLLDPAKEIAFDVELTDSGLTLKVPADRTLLDVIHSVGVDLACDCREGLCGSCEVEVIEGSIDHRDKVFSRAERAENRRMMACCSRSRDGGKLRIAL